MINLGLSRITKLLQVIAQSKGQQVYTPPWKAIHIAGTNGKGSVAAYLSALFRYTAKSNFPSNSHAGLQDDFKSIQLTRGGGSSPGSGFEDSVRVGRFTSPHFIDRWDCITINDSPVLKDDFLRVESEITKLAQQHLEEQPSNFEILTATAFELFSAPDGSACDVAILECGLGGRLDATNSLPDQNIAVSVITAIALDHVDLLGGPPGTPSDQALRNIGKEKFGIVRKGVPIISDWQNEHILKEPYKSLYGNDWDSSESSSAECMMMDFPPATELELTIGSAESLYKEDMGAALRHAIKGLSNLLPHQATNLILAREAYYKFWDRALHGEVGLTLDQELELLATAARDAPKSYPGRLQVLEQRWTDDPILPVLQNTQVVLDGAHNTQSAMVLRDFVDRKLRDSRVPSRGGRQTVIWILAISAGKEAEEMIRILMDDVSKSRINKVVLTGFGSVDGMPWVKSMDTKELEDVLASCSQQTQRLASCRHVLDALGVVESELTRTRDTDEQAALVVVAGSLYLVSNLLRFIRDGRPEFERYWHAPEHRPSS